LLRRLATQILAMLGLLLIAYVIGDVYFTAYLGEMITLFEKADSISFLPR